MTKRGLGKGLDALLATSSLAREKQQVASLSQSMSAEGELADLSISNLKPGIYQPRKDLSPEALEELAASIQSQGIIQPIVVRHLPTGGYEIIAGERRWRAATSGLKQVPVDQASGRSWCDRHGIDREHSARRSECDGRGTSARAFTKRI